MKKGTIIALSVVGAIVVILFAVFSMWRSNYNNFVELIRKLIVNGLLLKASTREGMILFLI